MKISKTKVLFAALATAFAASTLAAPVNLVQNGSFENEFAGWTVPTGATQPAVVIYYDSNADVPISAFHEAVPPANSTTLSPDAAGNRAAYFYDDYATDYSLSQQVFLKAGSYRVGFDAYAPQNGLNNNEDAHFSANIAGVQLADYAVSSQPGTTWINYSGLANVTRDGMYDISFVFNSFGRYAKDVVIDRVYAVSTDEDGGTDIPPNGVPEPTSIALLGLGLVALRAKTRRLMK